MDNTIQFPEGLAASPDYEIAVNGQSQFVHATEECAFCQFMMAEGETCDVSIRVPGKEELRSVVARPTSQNVEPILEANTIALALTERKGLFLDIPGLPELYLFPCCPENDAIDTTAGDVLSFEGGKIHDVGVVELHDRQTLHVAAGAVLKGVITARGCKDIRICGNGIIDGSPFERMANKRRSVLLESCDGIEISGVTLINPSTWMVVLSDCEMVHIHGIREIGECVSSDGIDVVGSQNVLIEDCFLRNNDDCVVLKAMERPADGSNTFLLDGSKPVRDVEIRNCVFYNAAAGNAMEIGFELRTESVSQVKFHDIDVIGAHGEGAVFSIHVGDRATVHDILWENIRVEHFYSRLIDFQVLNSRYSKDLERGHIRDIQLRNIHTIEDRFNTISLFGGIDPEHTVMDVTIQDLYIGEKKITNSSDLNLFLKNTGEPIFE